MSAPITGQVPVSGTPQPLSTSPVSAVAFTIKASISNGQSVYIGNSTVSTSTGHELNPGEWFEYERNDQHGQPRFQLNAQDFYVVGTSPDRVTWIASPKGES